MSLTSYQAAPPRNLASPTGGAGGSRTHNPQIRSLMLYPVELQPQIGKQGIVYHFPRRNARGSGALVKHLPEEEAAGGSRLNAGGARGGGLEELHYRLGALVALPDRDEKAHHGAHLLVEKAVAAHDESVARPRFLHFEGEDAANRRLEDAVGVRRKGDEIVLSDEVGRGLLHRGKVERSVAESPVWREVRRKDVRLVELIAVLLPLRGEASVEILLRIRRLEDADRVWEPCVHRPHEVLRGDRLRQVEVGDKAFRVDAGVCARRAIDANGRAVEIRKRLLDDLLDADGVLLILPAGIRRAVVGDDDAVFPHPRVRFLLSLLHGDIIPFSTLPWF